VKFLLKLIDISHIKRIPFRQDINGLRAVAVLAVVFYHADIELFKGGWLGVDIFFVISGYLISNIIISELNEGTFTFKNFYLRRVRRILPALFSTLLFTIPFSYILLTPKAMEEYINSLIPSVFFYSNYHFMNLDFYTAESTKVMPLLHTWSLAIEEQYYILFPLLAYLLYKYFKKYFIFLIGFIAVGSIYINSLSQSLDKFYKLEYRIWELLLGVLVMVLSNNFKINHLEKVGLPLMLYPLFYYDKYSVNDIEPKLIVLIGISLIIFSNKNDSYLTKLLSFKVLSIIGLSSYSIYLLHQPLFAFSRLSYTGRLLFLRDEEKYLLVILIIIFGYFSYIFIEKRNLKELSYKLILFSTSLIILFSLGSIFDNGYSSRYSDTNSQLKKYYLPEQRAGIDESRCEETLFDYEYFCNISYDPVNKNLIIIGDSHLQTLSSELIKDDELAEYNIFISLFQGCPFVLSLENNKSRANCAKSKKTEEFESIVSSGDTIIIYGGRFPWYFKGDSFETNLGTIGDDIEPGGRDLLAGIEENIRFLINNSIKLIIIYPIPELGYFPLEPYLYKFYDLNEEITYDVRYWKEYSKEVNNTLDGLINNEIVKIDPEEIFCNRLFFNSCTSSFNGNFYYYDDDHLTRDGARLVVNEIFDLVDF